MVGLMYDLLSNPLGAVRVSFEKAVSLGSDPSDFNGKDWGAIDLFRQFLNDSDCFSKVPFLSSYGSLRSVQPNKLVRFRGMVQDMFGNEMYIGAHKVGSKWKTNKFTDSSQFPLCSSADSLIWERRLLFCVPASGQNTWTEFPSMDQLRSRVLHPREKREREDQISDDEDTNSTSTKRMREVEPNNSFGEGLEHRNDPICSSSSSPISDTCLSCLVKVYDCPESELKLNEIFEFVGVYTFDQESEMDQENNGGIANLNLEDELVPFSLNKVPCFHSFIHRKLTTLDFLSGLSVAEPRPHLYHCMREAFLGHLAAMLGNDGLSAQFMLLHLLSRVQARVEEVAVGKLSLNLTCLTKEKASIFGSRITSSFSELLPFTHFMPLTVGFLNSTSLSPRKDYNSNRLVSGALQLAEGTHIVADETQLEAGTLNSIGVDNTRLLKLLLQFQKVEYNFTYYKIEMDVDVQMFVLSDGRSTILPADVVLPFRPGSMAHISGLPSKETLDAWRWYLATARLLPHSIDTDTQKVVEDDLVAARQADRALGTSDFSRMLTMARLVSASFGETSLSRDHWEVAKELERLRRDRLLK